MEDCCTTSAEGECRTICYDRWADLDYEDGTANEPASVLTTTMEVTHCADGLERLAGRP
jgi:hypothetical protein